jgi:hypothetical protein
MPVARTFYSGFENLQQFPLKHLRKKKEFAFYFEKKYLHPKNNLDGGCRFRLVLALKT